MSIFGSKRFKLCSPAYNAVMRHTQKNGEIDTSALRENVIQAEKDIYDPRCLGDPVKMRRYASDLKEVADYAEKYPKKVFEVSDGG